MRRRRGEREKGEDKGKDQQGKRSRGKGKKETGTREDDEGGARGKSKNALMTGSHLISSPQHVPIVIEHDCARY